MWKVSRKKSVAIIGHYASACGAGEFLREFRRRPDWECRLIVDRLDESQGFWKEYDAIYWPDLDLRTRRRLSRVVASATLTLLAGTPALDLWTRIFFSIRDSRTNFQRDQVARILPRFYRHCITHPTALLIADSEFLENVEFWNGHLERLEGLHVFGMPDKLPFIRTKSPVIPFWPAVDCRSIDAPPRGGEIRVGHSPSKETRRARKGSDFIEEVCAKNGVPLEVVSGLPYKDALTRKACFSVFIDQVPDFQFENRSWHGGLGKSGLEALALGCAVITGGDLTSTEPWFPDPPLVWTNRERLERDLLELLGDAGRIAELGSRGSSWAATTASPEALVDHILACAQDASVPRPPAAVE